MATLKRLTVRGFRSIRKLEDFELRSLNVLIGANGAGKSNFISLFKMLAELAAGRLQLFVQDQDGPERLLFGNSRQRTQQLDLELYFADSGYRISLQPSGERLLFSREETWRADDLAGESHPLGSGHAEAHLPRAEDDPFAPYVLQALRSWRVYHFHDTGASAPIRQAQPVRDNLRLAPDAANLAPFLRRLRAEFPPYYERILRTLQLAAPFLGGFIYRETVNLDERIDLEWYDTANRDKPYGPRQLSDGTLRFIALTTLLLQPAPLQPDTLLIDEPELGLHPYALSLLAGLLQQAAESRQVIVSTQSVELVNELSPQDVVVVNRKDGASELVRLVPEELTDWLEDYSLGELWKRNVIGGRPAR